MARLLATMVSGVLAWWLTGVAITSLDVPVLDTLLSLTLFSVAFTAFAVGGVANAINIIDGFNGQASGFVILALIGLALMATTSHDSNLALTCLCLAAAVLGFWLVNWPWGKIFLGDGGSYFVGFALAWFCVMLVERNREITAFAPLLVCIHPVTEVLFSIYRRRIRSHHPGHPDRLHLHSLAMRRLVRPWLGRLLHSPAQVRQHENAVTGLLIACMTLPSVVMAYLLRDQPLWAALGCLGFMVGYVLLYARLVCMRWCLPMGLMHPKANLTI
jgi:UDP-N-acetylmuramyl pentapeptide phosphotransferase/UDP-N-acetylglucosamine-1-phosphate transferase